MEGYEKTENKVEKKYKKKIRKMILPPETGDPRVDCYTQTVNLVFDLLSQKPHTTKEIWTEIKERLKDKCPWYQTGTAEIRYLSPILREMRKRGIIKYFFVKGKKGGLWYAATTKEEAIEIGTVDQAFK